MEGTFQTKYDEFCVDLEATCPELKEEISVASDIPNDQRVEAYKINVLKVRRTAKDHIVLPGVTIPESIWVTLSKNSQEAINKYNSILDLCVIYQTGDVEGFDQNMIDEMMREWRTRMDGLDFDKLSSKFFDIFGKHGEALPPLPEKFLKGKMAKLAEDLVKEFDPEDFGFTAKDVEECEKDPSKAFEILMKISTTDPAMIQNSLQKIGKKLQQKIQSGQLKPEELAAEAEELIKEFQSNPAFVDILESFRSAFSYEDMDVARSTGNEGSGRLALVRKRLKKKLDAKKNKQL
jgi:hypothetical protein